MSKHYRKENKLSTWSVLGYASLILKEDRGSLELGSGDPDHNYAQWLAGSPSSVLPGWNPSLATWLGPRVIYFPVPHFLTHKMGM